MLPLQRGFYLSWAQIIALAETLGARAFEGLISPLKPGVKNRSITSGIMKEDEIPFKAQTTLSLPGTNREISAGSAASTSA